MLNSAEDIPETIRKDIEDYFSYSRMETIFVLTKFMLRRWRKAPEEMADLPRQSKYHDGHERVGGSAERILESLKV